MVRKEMGAGIEALDIKQCRWIDSIAVQKLRVVVPIVRFDNVEVNPGIDGGEKNE